MSGKSFSVHVRPDLIQRLPYALRWTAWLMPLHALLLVWGTWKRQPSPSTQFAQWADFVLTDHFLWSHLIASIGGQTVGMVGVTALTALAVVRGAPIRPAAVGLLLYLLGSGLMLSGFGVAAFTQPAIGELHESQPAVATQLYDAVYGPAAFVVLLTGLALFSFSTVATGAALAASGGVPRWTGRVYAVAGPVFGVVGFLFGTFQTLGALALALASATTAITLNAGHPSDTTDPSRARGTLSQQNTASSDEAPIQPD
jgi:hypothetical protein